MRRMVIHPSDLGMSIGMGAGEIHAVLDDAGAEILSPVYARYHEITETAIDLEIGYIVAAKVGDWHLAISELPAGREAVLVHEGAYDELRGALEELSAWIEANAEKRDAPWELYLTVPDELPVADWRTEVVWPIV